MRHLRRNVGITKRRVTNEKKSTTAVKAGIAVVLIAVLPAAATFGQGLTFPQGTATPSETCGTCQKAFQSQGHLPERGSPEQEREESRPEGVDVCSLVW